MAALAATECAVGYAQCMFVIDPIQVRHSWEVQLLIEDHFLVADFDVQSTADLVLAESVRESMLVDSRGANDERL